MASWVLPGDAEDREILDATRRADPSAFDLLYRNYSAAVRSLCRRLLTDNTAAADDACQETMLKAYQALPRFRPGARIWPWLSTIARNVCTDMHRDRQRVIVCAEPPVREVSPGPEEIAASRTRVQILRVSLRRVERRQRMYVYLRDAFGWSYEQIADFDHTTVPAVRSVLHRGRGTLRDTVITVARERHEWPLPAFVPVLWLRARVRVSQARDWAGSWLSRLDPSSAVSAVVGSAAFVHAAIAVVSVAGGSSPEPSPVVFQRSAATQTSVSQPSGVVVGLGGAAVNETTDDALPATPAAGTPVAPEDRLNVVIDGGVDKYPEEGGTQYRWRPTSGNVDLDGYAHDPSGDLGFKADLNGHCPPPEQRDAFWEANCVVFGAVAGD